MKKTIRIALIAVFTLTACKLSAQLGIEFGYDFMHGRGSLALGNEGHFTGRTRHSGFRAGLTYDFNIKGNLFIHSGLAYSYTAANMREREYTLSSYSDEGTLRTRSTYQQIELPIRVKYDLPVTNDFKFFVFGGPVLGYTFSGQMFGWTFQSDDGGYNRTDYENSAYDLYATYHLRPFELRLGAGLGAHYKHYLIKFSYDWGLFNQYTRGTSSSVVRHNHLAVTLGYTF